MQAKILNFIIKRLFIFLLLLSVQVTAQDSSTLPKITPSYSQDFSNLKSYPSICFSDIFSDKKGRLWLKTCLNSSLISLHLFQFDGYEFRLIHELKELGGQTRIIGITDAQELVGFEFAEKVGRIFFFNLETRELSFQELPEEGRIEGLQILTDDQLQILVSQGNKFAIYEWDADHFNLKIRFTSPLNSLKIENRKQDLNPQFYQDDLWLFGRVSEDEFIQKINCTTGETKTYSLADFQMSPEEKKNIQINAVPIGTVTNKSGQIYINLAYEGRKHWLFKLDVTIDKFVPLNDIPKLDIGAFGKRVFEDQSGNQIFFYGDEFKVKLEAVLKDQNGKLYDYSEFFKSLSRAQVLSIKGKNFKKELLISSSKGIMIHQIKSKEYTQNFLLNKSIRAMVEFPNQDVLISHQGLGHYIFNKKTGQVNSFDPDGCDIGKLDFSIDQSGFIWGQNPTAIVRYDPVSNICEQFPINNEEVRHVELIHNDRIAYVHGRRSWKLGLFNIKTQTVSNFQVEGKDFEFEGYVNQLFFGKNNILWGVTAKGLYKIDIDQQSFEVYGNEPPFLENRFLCIDETEDGLLWLGTPMDGLYIFDLTSNELKVLNSDKGLANNTVVTIQKDAQGDRWVGTYNGISLVSAQGDLITNFYVEDGLANRESNRYAKLKTSDGQIFMGTVQGLSVINPEKLKESQTKIDNFQIYLTSLKYFDETTDQDIVIKRDFDNIKKITLPAANRELNIQFATSNYFKPEENIYAYQLEGEHDHWKSIGTQKNLNLDFPPGKHRLLIRAGDGKGNWTATPIMLNVHAKEFFFKTVTFYILCGLLIIGGALLWIVRLRSAVRTATRTIQKDKEIIEAQAEKLKELDKAKSQFFTNISHEFRTPLTIISGMIDQIRSKPDVWLEKGSVMIKQNTLNLLNLINQILDLRKLESQKLTLNLVQGNIVRYLQYLTDSFSSYAENQGMKLHFICSKSSILMDYDPDKILKIISNLLSNAIKYNKEKEDVYFQVDEMQNNDRSILQIKVQDNGEGIPKEKLPNIFGRFYQVNEPGKEKVVGSGIGLALTQELVTLMNGKIEVSSEIGVGTTFIVQIPITRNSTVQAAFDEVQIDTPEPVVISSTSNTEPVVVPNLEKEDSDQANLLIVEDNPEIVQILVACLEDHYQLQVARNGREGIEKAIEQVPDIIISDVMMPEKTGYELTDTLKNDERTSHIPIILLTAKSDLDSKISGLEKGADAYLAKPFEEKELLVRLKKLLELRKKLQARYQSLELPKEPATKEDAFLIKVQNTIHDNIDDEDFGIVQLCRAVGLSRSQIHNKIKALTGLSTSIYIRNLRLQKANQLLKTTDLNVSEIAYEVGFKDPRYFSRVYSEKFGESPSETRK